jgi:hypothetical protein
MAVIIETQTPKRLLRQIRNAIDDGTVQTWAYDVEGDFTLTSDQMIGQAWMTADADREGRLVFNILGKNGQRMSKSVYAIFHSRLVQMCLTYFDESCRMIRVTSQPTSGDAI